MGRVREKKGGERERGQVEQRGRGRGVGGEGREEKKEWEGMMEIGGAIRGEEELEEKTEKSRMR